MVFRSVYFQIYLVSHSRSFIEMNASRLLQVVEVMRASEARVNLQSILTSQVATNLQNLASNPQQAQYQEGLRTGIDALGKAQQRMLASFGPEDVKAIEELKGSSYFVEDLGSKVDVIIGTNQATLAVASRVVQEFVKERNDYLTDLQNISEILPAIGIDAQPLQPGEVELGVTMPRGLFSNTLDGLQSELKVLNRMVRSMSEAATGSVEQAVIVQISTTDPLFVLGLPMDVVVMIGGCVNWALATWKQVEEIRKVRADVRKLNLDASKAMVESLEDSMKRKVNNLIDDKVREILGDKAADAGRPQEQRNDLCQVLTILLDKVSQGMTFEIRLGPPPKPVEESTPEQEELASKFSQLQATRSKLVFPKTDGEPMSFLSNSQSQEPAGSLSPAEPVAQASKPAVAPKVKASRKRKQPTPVLTK